MRSLAWMKVGRRRAGGTKRSGKFLGHEPGFPHSSRDDLSLTFEQGVNGIIERNI
jgi:hypothetical protein